MTRREVFAAAGDPYPYGTVPETSRAALTAGRDALRVAAALAREHATGSDATNMRLRAAAALVWIAFVAACQLILLRRDRNVLPTGGADDVDRAGRIAATGSKRDVAFWAESALVERRQLFLPVGDNYSCRTRPGS
jgi:hypothetical protein